MSERKWTPGPWRVCTEAEEDYARQVGGHYDVGMDGSDSYTIAALIGDIPELQRCERANAQLIAAAPELYEALERIQWKSAHKDNMEFSALISFSTMDRIRAALKKARGET